jgi:hypothetical protein
MNVGRLITRVSADVEHTFHVGGARIVTAAKFNFHDYIDKLFGVKPSTSQPMVVAPTSGDYSQIKGVTLTALQQVYLNNVLGCCVPAALLHVRGVWTAFANAVAGGKIFSDDELRSFYTLLSGGLFDPNNAEATDQGCDIVTALNLLIKTGYPDGQKPLGFMAVDSSNWAHVTQAAWLFEGLVTGSCLSDNALNTIPTDPTGEWDMSGPPNPKNGHCMALVAWGPDTGKIGTWGRVFGVKRQDSQYAFGQAQGGGLWAVLDQDVIDRATLKSPTGFDFDALTEDMKEFQAAS